MPRRVVWYPAGSSTASLLSTLPGDLEARPLPARGVPHPAPDEGAVLLLDQATGDAGPAAGPGPAGELRLDIPSAAPAGIPIVAIVPAGAAPPPGCYAAVPAGVAPALLAVTLRNACDHARVGREADATRRDLERLNQIGVGLSAERDTDALLGLILEKAREITSSDAGSIYLVEDSPGAAPRLRFKLAQIDAASVAGHVALTSSLLQLDDAYVLPPGSPFHINRDFDERVGYRTRSMLVVPMATPQGVVIGVLQLINCKRHANARLDGPAAVEAEVIPYPERFRSLTASLASQAAVALENSRLYQSIQTLFEGFVQASVIAIE